MPAAVDPRPFHIPLPGGLGFCKQAQVLAPQQLKRSWILPHAAKPAAAPAALLALDKILRREALGAFAVWLLSKFQQPQLQCLVMEVVIVRVMGIVVIQQGNPRTGIQEWRHQQSVVLARQSTLPNDLPMHLL